MNAMGHAVPTMIGVDHRGLIGKIQKVVPDYMLMGSAAWVTWKAWKCPSPKTPHP